MEGDEEGGGNSGPIVWTNAMSAFVLKFLAELVTTGVRTDKGFKSCHLNACSRALMDHFHMQVNGFQIGHHLKKWRRRWSKINTLKKISGANWDDATKSIMLEPSHYTRHVMVHTLHHIVYDSYSHVLMCICYKLFITFWYSCRHIRMMRNT